MRPAGGAAYGTLWPSEQEFVIRVTGALGACLLTATWIAGCGGKITPKAKPKEDSPFSNASIETGAATLDMYTTGEDRTKSFTLGWETATASAKDETHYVVDAHKVSGQLYRAGRLVARFTAAQGSADKGSGTLKLSGNVVVKAVDQNSQLEGSTLACDSITYATSDEIIKATGGVVVRGKDAEMGPFPEVWCSNDLSEVASPDAFVPVRHNHASAPKL